MYVEAVPAWLRYNASRGVAWVAQGRGGPGLRPQTIDEARAMAQGRMTIDKATRMVAWFARHLVDLDAPRAKPGADGYPSPGVVAHALWGGGTRAQSMRALAWARRAIESNRKPRI